MDARDMYFKGWHFLNHHYYHPGDTTKSKSMMVLAPYLPRSLAPPTYVLIDFGNANQFREGEPAVFYGECGYNYPPEMKPGGACNAFKAEIWCLGYMIKKFLDAVRSFLTHSHKDHLHLCGSMHLANRV
jgi:hypothetical protein